MSTSGAERKPISVQTVLLLDGDVLVRMPLAQYLRDCGYRVLEAADADEAIAILQKPDIQVDVVLSDIELPGSLSGFDFALRARSLRAGLEIVLAGTPSRAVDAAAKLCDGGPKLMKPYDPQLVLAHIKRLLAAERGRKGADAAFPLQHGRDPDDGEGGCEATEPRATESCHRELGS